jgi:hypothetical protein
MAGAVVLQTTPVRKRAARPQSGKLSRCMNSCEWKAGEYRANLAIIGYCWSCAKSRLN